LAGRTAAGFAGVNQADFRVKTQLGLIGGTLAGHRAVGTFVFQRVIKDRESFCRFAGNFWI